MTEEQLRDEAITLFNAGLDSTAAAISWGLVSFPQESSRL
jgi:cytochrome P450